MKKKTLVYLILISTLLSACSATLAAPTATAAAMMESETPEAMMVSPTPAAMMEPATPEAMMSTETPGAMMASSETPGAMMESETPDAMVASPAWLAAPLTNVETGKPFTITDYKGKVALVEITDTMCAPCMQQEQQIKSFLAASMIDKLAVLSLAIDASGTASTIKTYVDKEGFSWAFALASMDVTQEIGKLYGAQYVDRSSDHLLIVDTAGAVHPVPAGVQSVDDLKNLVAKYSGM